MRVLLLLCVTLVAATNLALANDTASDTAIDTFIDPPAAAMKLIEEFQAKQKVAKDKLEAEISALRAKAAQETEAAKKQLVAELEKVRAQLEKEEKHNEARAVAAKIRSVVAPPIRAAQAPANMTAHATDPANFDKPFFFRITGRLEGSNVWGVGPYTSDSDLYRAVVHSGVLASGETGVVKVTVISTVGLDFAGSTQNGVASSPYTAWTAGYRVERVTSEEAEGVIEAEDPPKTVTAPPGALTPPPGTTSTIELEINPKSVRPRRK